MKFDFMTDSYAMAGLRNMKRVGSNQHLNIVVQLDDSSFGSPERLLIAPGRSISVAARRRAVHRSAIDQAFSSTASPGRQLDLSCV